MKNFNIKKCIDMSLIFIMVIFIRWIFVCGVVNLLSLCCGFQFSWILATKIWIVLFLLRNAVDIAKKKN